MRTFDMYEYIVCIVFTMGTLLSVCSGYELKKFYDEMFDLHNKYRAIHNAPDLIYDDELSKKAIECEELHTMIEEDDDMLISGDVTYLVYKAKYITRIVAKDLFKFWYIQGRNYDYTQEPKDWNTEHFTQIVWKSTTKLGFAMLEKSDETWFVAAYSPPGNQVDQYVANVGEPNTEVDLFTQ